MVIDLAILRDKDKVVRYLGSCGGNDMYIATGLSEKVDLLTSWYTDIIMKHFTNCYQLGLEVPCSDSDGYFFGGIYCYWG